MRILYRFFFLLAISSLTVLSGCREDEDLNLLTYPDNNFTLAADDEDGSEITVNATYNNDGILEFDKPVTFTFRFNASPEETIVTFEPMGENVELSDTKLIIPAGYTDANVTLNVKDMEAFQSNYDEAMLRCGPYPYPLKRRIASDSGHLSNDSSALEARTLVDSGTTRLVLGHLSKENNHPELARETVRSELTLAGMAEGGDYLLSVAPRTEPGPMMIF